MRSSCGLRIGVVAMLLCTMTCTCRCNAPSETSEPTESLAAPATGPASPDRPTTTPADATLTPTLTEPFVYESPMVRLDWYLEQPEGSLMFLIYIVNLSLEPLAGGQARVVLYNAAGDPLSEGEEGCSAIGAFSEMPVVVEFGQSSIADDYSAYNIYVDVTTEQGEHLTAQLSEQPVSGTEGETISEGRRVPTPQVGVDWRLPAGGYSPGAEVEAEMGIQLYQGQLADAVGCLEIDELQRREDGQDVYVPLGEQCEEMALNSGDSTLVIVAFEPSGFTWLSQQGSAGMYTPLEIRAQASVSYSGIVLAEADDVLHLPPIEVVSAWWEQDGVPADDYVPGEPYLANVRVRSLAEDPESHRLLISVRYSEQDPEEWIFGFMFLWLHCLVGLCGDEVEVESQAYEIELAAGEEATYSVPVQPPLHPTDEVGIFGHMYLNVEFEGFNVWRGGTVPSVSEP
jgi:hypothetical protein